MPVARSAAGIEASDTTGHDPFFAFRFDAPMHSTEVGQIVGRPLTDFRSTHAGLTSQRTSAAGSVQSRHNSVTSQHTARSNGSHVSYRSDVKVFDGRGGGAGGMRRPAGGR